MNSFRPEEEYAFGYFRNLGLTVLPIPRSEAKTAECFVDGDVTGYAVEVKARHDSEEWARTIRSGDAAVQERSFSAASWAEDMARVGLRQLRTVDPNHDRWWIIWVDVLCKGGQDAMAQEVFASLFGVRQIVCAGKDNTAKSYDCLYAVPGVFERHKELAGVVVCFDRQSALAINEFASDAGRFEDSQVWKDMNRRDALVDPNVLIEQPGKIKVVDLQIDRRDEKSVLKHLSEVYKIDAIHVIQMKQHSATMRVQNQ